MNALASLGIQTRRPPPCTSALLALLSLSVGLGLGGCGVIGTGGGATVNDATPDGLLLKQATFFGQNGKTVTGTAAIYTASSSGAFILRLDGLSAPSESGLLVRVVGNGSQVFSSSLRASSGSMNYTLDLSGISTWNSVSIYSSTAAQNYGTATF